VQVKKKNATGIPHYTAPLKMSLDEQIRTARLWEGFNAAQQMS
jgi:hypothetical protein